MIRTVFLALLVLGCGSKASKGREAAAKDRQCAEAVADGKVAEARGWLSAADGGHAGFKVDKAQMREITEAFYAAGAAQVRAAYSELGGAQVSALLVVDLPADKAARGALFAHYATLVEAYELDAATDVGQGCLLVGLD